MDELCVCSLVVVLRLMVVVVALKLVVSCEAFDLKSRRSKHNARMRQTNTKI